MSDLFGNHIVGFPSRRLNFIECILVGILNLFVSMPSHEKRAFGVFDTNMALKSQDKAMTRHWVICVILRVKISMELHDAWQ